MHQLPEQWDSTTNQFVKQPHDILIDTDIGDDIDDALALAVALRSHEIIVRGVTTVFGDTQRRAQLAAHLLHTFGRDDIPVAAGILTPLQPNHRPSGVPQAAILSPDKHYPMIQSVSGPDFIIQTASAYYGRLTLICIGPLTNIATALLQEPDVFMAIRSIVMMGGTSGFPLPEWNVRSDAQAAQIVLASGIPITMLGVNVTLHCQLQDRDIACLNDAGSPQTQLLSTLLAVWRRHRPRWQPSLPFLHDPLTIAALCKPELFSFQEMTARVLTRKPLQGFMVPRVMNGPLVRAITDIQVGKAREWVMQRLL